MILHRRRRDVANVIERRVVVRNFSHAGEVDPGDSCALENGEIRIVRQQLVQIEKERAGAGTWQAARDERKKPAIVAAGLEKIAAARCAAIVDVDRRCDAARTLRIGHECFGAEETVFFAVGDEEKDGVAEAIVTNHARHLQNRGEADSIIGSARTGGHRVVMRAEHQRVGSRVAGQPCEHIRHRRARRVRVARECLLQRCLVSEPPELGNDPVADEIVGSGADRMRRVADENRIEHNDCARRGKLIGRRVRRERCRSVSAGDRHGKKSSQDQEHGCRGAVRSHARIVCNL